MISVTQRPVPETLLRKSIEDVEFVTGELNDFGDGS
jgi:hypothetical protein